jgi:hypothetical protein
LLRNDVIVFQAYAALKRSRIDARLDCDHIADFEDIVAAGNHARRFVAAISNAMPDVMPETLLREGKGLELVENIDFGEPWFDDVAGGAIGDGA